MTLRLFIYIHVFICNKNVKHNAITIAKVLQYIEIIKE